MERNYTAEDVKRYRDKHSCSIFEAKGHFEKKFFMDMISEARLTGNTELLIDVVEALVRREKFW